MLTVSWYQLRGFTIDDLETLVKGLNCCICDVFPELRKHHRRKKR